MNLDRRAQHTLQTRRTRRRSVSIALTE